MNEQDKLIVQAAKLYDHDDIINSLVLLIDRLDKQLKNIVEAADPFVEKHETPVAADYRRLAQAVKEVQDE